LKKGPGQQDIQPETESGTDHNRSGKDSVRNRAIGLALSLIRLIWSEEYPAVHKEDVFLDTSADIHMNELPGELTGLKTVKSQ